MTDKKKFLLPEVSDNHPEVSVESGLQTKDDKGIHFILTQAWDGHGNSLIRENRPNFDDFPGVTLWLELPDGQGGEVTLSPIHGDPRKKCFTEIAPGTNCEIFGPKGGKPLKTFGRCSCGGSYRSIYLTQKGEKGEVVLICNVWGCLRSRIIDSSEILSAIDY